MYLFPSNFGDLFKGFWDEDFKGHAKFKGCQGTLILMYQGNPTMAAIHVESNILPSLGHISIRQNGRRVEFINWFVPCHDKNLFIQKVACFLIAWEMDYRCCLAISSSQPQHPPPNAESAKLI